MRCDDVAEELPGVIDGNDALDRGQRRHVDSCLRCQAELAQYRRLARGLRSLSTQLTPAPGLVADIIAALEGAEPEHRASSMGRRAAYLSGLAAATAGAAGAIVLASRARSRRLAG